LGARRKLSPIVGAGVVRTGGWDSGCCRFRGDEDVLGATADLAGNSQSCPSAAAARDGVCVELVVGAGVAVRVLRGLDERPSEVA
jgi:hypothetical protein